MEAIECQELQKKVVHFTEPAAGSPNCETVIWLEGSAAYSGRKFYYMVQLSISVFYKINSPSIHFFFFVDPCRTSYTSI